MYYPSRAVLGELLAKVAPHPPESLPIVLCLKSRSLQTCQSLARRLNTEVVLLRYEPICYPGDPSRIIGAVLPGGVFCRHPDVSEPELRYIASELSGLFADAQRAALRRLNRECGLAAATLSDLTGRSVLVAADILTDRMPVAVAQMALKRYRSADMYGVVANATAEVGADLQRLCSGSRVLHRLPHGLFDDDHYIGTPAKSRAELVQPLLPGRLYIPSRRLLYS